MSKNVCFIGHRRIFKNIKDRLRVEVEKQINLGANFFTMGTHGDFDKLALSVCREMRKTYLNIDVEVVITSYKTLKKKMLYQDAFGKVYDEPYADVKTVMYDIENYHFKRQIIMSNKKMVDNCDVLICYVDRKRSPSGAKTIMNYARKNGLERINLFDTVYSFK